MKISFVIPAYNEEKVIAECLASIQKEIARYAYETEIVVVANNCTDRTKEIALSFAGVRVVDEERKGIVFARECGMNHSVGALIANVDADVLVPEGWLKTVMESFARDAQLVALSGPYIYYDISVFHRALVRLFYYGGYGIYLLNNYIFKVSGMLQGGNFIVRREAMEKIGGYDTSISFYGEDTDIAKRIRAVGKVRFTFVLPMYTSGRRLREEGICKTGLTYAINYIWPILFSKPFTKTYRDIRE